MTDFLTHYWLPASLAGGLLTLCIWLLRPLWARLRAGFSRALLLLACLLFLLPFAPLARLAATAGLPPVQVEWPAAPAKADAAPGITPAGKQTAAPAQTGKAASGPQSPATTIQTSPAPAPAPREKAIDPAGLAAALYLAGLGLSAGLFCLRYARLCAQLRKSRRPETAPDVLDTYTALCAEYRLRRAPALYRCTGLRSPALAGLLRPALYLPQGPLSAEQLEFALRHELTHLKHRDIPLKLALLALRAVHWCNPLAWLLGRMAEENCEALCDEAVAGRLPGGQRCAYAATLLAFAAGPRLAEPSFAFASPAKTLKRRLDNLLHPKNPTRPLHCAAALALCLALALGLLAGCAAAGANQTESAPAGSSSTPPPASLAMPTASSAPVASGSKLHEEQEASVMPNIMRGWPLPGWPNGNYYILDEQDLTLQMTERPGCAILAVAPGTVKTVVTGDANSSYGNYIVVAHNDGMETLYANCDMVLAKEGDEVNAGDGIAAVGQNGLLFQITKEGQPQDPMSYIDEDIRLLLEQEPTLFQNSSMLWPVPSSGTVAREGGTGQNHRGIDITAEAGSPIVTVAGGIVTTAGWHYSYGNHVVIDHGNGLMTLYAHCQELSVSEGQSVEAGHVIATVGDTGFAFSKHLHFEVQQKEGGLLNPRDYLPQPPATGDAAYVSGTAESENWLWPVPDYVYVSRSGGPGLAHRGMDICAPKGTAILAVADGTVTTAGWQEYYGNYIIIDHGNDLLTLYASCDSLLVDEGQAVKAGGKIATMGDAACSSNGVGAGNHLHLEVQNGDGSLADPHSYLTAPRGAGVP